jgi:tetratricopeptide (TPR) repeat protein
MDEAVRAAYDAQRDFSKKGFKSGCYAPFAAMYFTPLGDALVCCKNESYILGNLTRERLPEIWKGRQAANLRKALNAYRYDMGCEFCEWQIAAGNHKGVFAERYEWLEVPSSEPEWPAMMEFAISNTCNFECVMCTGELSSSIRARREGLPPLPKVYSDQFFEDLRPYLRHLRQANFYGGEPFLTQECFRIWDMIIEDKLNVPCHVTTNASQWNAKVEQVLESIWVSLSVSVDGATRETVEKIRVNCDYDEYFRNLHRFRDYSKRRGSHMGISHCLMRQNWHEFADVLLLAESLECPVFVNTVISPDHCSLYSMDERELARIVDELDRQTARLAGKLKINQHVWDEQLRTLRDSANKGHEEIFTQIQAVDVDVRQLNQNQKYSMRKGWALCDAGRFQEALEEVRKADEKDPQFYESLVISGHARRMLRDFDQADADLTRAIKISRKPIEAHVHRGWVRRDQKRYQEGVEDALRAIELCKANDRYREQQYYATVLLGHLRRTMGDKEQSEADLNSAVELSPKPWEALMDRAWLRRQQKRYEEGVEDARKASEFCGGNDILRADIYEALSCLAAHAGKIEDAREALDRLLECRPAAPSSRVWRAYVFQLAGLLEEAMAEIEAALALDKDYADAVRFKEHLGASISGQTDHAPASTGTAGQDIPWFAV